MKDGTALRENNSMCRDFSVAAFKINVWVVSRIVDARLFDEKVFVVLLFSSVDFFCCHLFFCVCLLVLLGVGGSVLCLKKFKRKFSMIKIDKRMHLMINLCVYYTKIFINYSILIK